jgi:hypothetical protein
MYTFINAADVADAADKAAANGGARRISKRSELRECIADSCGGLRTPAGEYVLAAWCWEIGAETRDKTREYWRGRTVIVLPVL